ncbi:putative major facilitator superfamily permease-4 [Coleophoma cylindrospora]|uniref:Putative major facilitator superfamily permease-4 n=1 Tax=Coleophoma cylindrospora TaxID=1849047 RepID=A0A3D8QSK6_9HELO|nr:putative major facilitator superfamily permease-4 [Coleophoma cylindrospora]
MNPDIIEKPIGAIHVDNASKLNKNHASPDNVDYNGSDEVDFSHIDEKAVLRKMDLRLIPMLALLYLLSFLDRGNIGNAKIEGLTETLHMDGPQYNWCLTVFFFTYCVFEIPSNLMLKRLRPSIWLPTIMVAWGVVMTLMGIVQSYHGLLIARLFLGVTEAGLYPGVAYYITMWYCRDEAQFRQAMFFSAASVAGAFSGLLAFGIAHMDGVGGLEGWRWIFILEGIVTVLVAVAAYFVIYDFPETAAFLTPDERAWVVHRLRYQGSQGSGQMVAEAEHFDWKYVIGCFTDWQIYVGLLMYWGIVCPLYGISLFLPTIINELGYVSSTAQLLTVPIYITAAVLSVVTAFYSDRSKVGRAPYVFLPMCAILVGFIMALAGSAHGGVPGVVYAGVFIATCGLYPAFPGNICWMSNNLAGSYKRSAGMALHIGVGNLGGAMASNFYRASDKPKYILGHSLEIAFVSVGLVAVLVLRLNYARINKERNKHGNMGYSVEKLSQMGDKAPTFRYML